MQISANSSSPALLPARAPAAGVARARAELAGVYDEAEIAAWFATPNAWLGGCAPAELAACAPDEVVQAARADRFVARG